VAGSSAAGRPQGQDTRERILRVASQLFARKGYTGTSTREIAAAVGVRQPSLFHHFASKRQIVETLLAYSIEDAADKAWAAAAAPGPAAERLYRFVYEDTAYLCGSPYDLSGVHVTEIMQDDAFSYWHGRLERLHEAIREMVRQGVASGEFAAVDPSFAQEMITAMNIVNIRRYSGRLPEVIDEVAVASADFVLRALLADGAALDEVRARALARGSAFPTPVRAPVRRVVDLTMVLDERTPVYPGDPAPRLEPAATIGVDGFNVLALHLGSHSGTHVDAPRHFLAEGPALEQVDLALLSGPAAIVDLRGLGPREPIGWAALEPHAQRLRPGTILALWTGWSESHLDAYEDHPYLDPDACARVLELGVRTIAIDALNPDPTGGAEFPVHRLVFAAGGVIAENLTNLSAVDLDDPYVFLLPLRLGARADGAPCRAIAVDVWAPAPTRPAAP
jgi:kynurenine formamidase/AcrR family transcriptional regulator